MVLKNIKRIQQALPEVQHIVMFYNSGTVFQTTFEPPFNIPKIGENLAEAVNHMLKLYEELNSKQDDYRKLIFETDENSIIILRLGENSNVALLFKRSEEKEIKLQSIRRYLSKIEELIDMDTIELFQQELESKLTEIKDLDILVDVNKNGISDIESQLALNPSDDVKEKLNDKLHDLKKELEDLEEQKKPIEVEIAILKQKITELEKQDAE